MFPEGTYGRIASRSSLSVLHKVEVVAGVIDPDYRGEIFVNLFNHSKNDFIINIGDRIAQIICEKISIPKLEEVYHMPETTRGSGGFGSSGK